MTKTLLEVHGLGMQYAGQVLFRDLGFVFGPGIVALTGRNGAGKSTLLSLLAGMHAPQQGRILIDGHDLARSPRRARRQLAFAPDESVAYDFMTGDEFLRMVLALRGQAGAPALANLMEGFGLQPHGGKRFEAMSLGTRKKFMLASSLASDAPVVLMDEPTNGIDAQAKGFLLDVFQREQMSRLFLFSTHDLDALAHSRAQEFALPDPNGRQRAA